MNALFKDFTVTKSGSEIRELIKLRYNAYELEDEYPAPEDRTILDTLRDSVKDNSYYSLTLQQMSFLLGKA